jgi:hypothetical protein
MKVQAICEGGYNSTTIMMEGIKKYSKYDIEIRQFSIAPEENPDIILYMIADFANNSKETIEEHKEIKWLVAITDLANFKRFIGWGFGNQPLFEHMSGILAGGEAYYEMCKQYTKDIPLYLYEYAADSTFFTRQQKPKYFSVGLAELLLHYQKDPILKNYLNYPYSKMTSSMGIGTSRTYPEMRNFYKNISVFVDPKPEEQPGGMMFLEAGAVGRPSIAMKSATLARWFPKEYLAKDTEDVINILHQLHDDVEYYQKASDIWYDVAKSRDYSVMAKEFDYAFDHALGVGV